MLCLSVRQPWAGLIVAGLKCIECRTWRTTFRGRILIHAGRKYSTEVADLTGINPEIITRLLEPQGIVLGEADIIDCRPATRQDAARAMCAVRPGDFAWVFTNAIRFRQRWRAPGKLGLFEMAAPRGTGYQAMPDYVHLVEEMQKEQIPSPRRSNRRRCLRCRA